MEKLEEGSRRKMRFGSRMKWVSRVRASALTLTHKLTCALRVSLDNRVATERARLPISQQGHTSQEQARRAPSDVFSRRPATPHRTRIYRSATGCHCYHRRLKSDLEIFPHSQLRRVVHQLHNSK